MFKDEKMYLIDTKEDRSLKLTGDDGRVLALIFIKGDELIIRTGGVVESTTIESPNINIL